MHRSHTLTLLFALVCFFGLSVQPALAGVGVVVRLVSTSGALEGDVGASIVNTAGTEVAFTLLDDGNAPDVFAGDNQYSAAGLLDGLGGTVFLTVNGKKTEAGEVAWQDQTTPRDLVITMGEGILTVETGVATPVDNLAGEPKDGPGGGQGAQMDPAQDPGSGSASGSGTPARAPNVSFPGGQRTAQDDTTLYLLGGALVLVLAIAAFLWLRAPSSDGGSARGSRHYELQPEPGLLGSVTPSLSDGLSTWKVSPADAPGFLELLLQSMAQHHRVLVVASDETTLPVVPGGPVYKAREHSAVAVADAAISLMDQPGLPLAVLVVQAEIGAALLSDYSTVLTPDVGVVALVSEIKGEHLFDVDITRSEDGWRVQRGDTGVHIGLTEWGVRVSRIGTPSAEPTA